MDPELFGQLDSVIRGIIKRVEFEPIDFPNRSTELAEIAEIIYLANQLASPHRNLLDYHDQFESFTPSGYNLATPLIMAIYRHDPELVQTFLELGANPNLSSQRGNFGWTPLDIAAHINNRDIIEMLLDAGATQMAFSVTPTLEDFDQWDRLRDLITARQQYAPGGPGYQEAREAFEQHRIRQ